MSCKVENKLNNPKIHCNPTRDTRLLTFYEDEQRATVQLVDLNHIRARFLCKSTHTDTTTTTSSTTTKTITLYNGHHDAV